MRLLDRYLIRELMMPLGVCIGGFLIFWVGFDLLANLSEFRSLHLKIGDVAELYAHQMPELLITVLPVAMLLALLYALTTHSRHQEITAMRSAGISLGRICLPYLVVGLFASVFLLLLNEVWFPDAVDRVERIKQRHSADRAKRAWRERLVFQNRSAGRNWHLGAFNLASGEMRSPSFREWLPAAAHRSVEAEVVRWTDDSWRGEKVRESVFRDQQDSNPGIRETGFLRLTEFTVTTTDVFSARSEGAIALTNGLLRTNLSGGPSGAVGSWQAVSFSTASNELRGLIFLLPATNRLERYVQAEGAVWTQGGWEFRGVREYLYRFPGDDNPVTRTHPVAVFPDLDESPELIRSEIKVGARNTLKVMRKPRLSVREVIHYLRLHPDLPTSERNYIETQFHARLATPWTCLVVVFIAIPFGVPVGRRNIFYGVAGSIGIAFSYFVLQRVGYALGQSGVVPSWVGAWLPNGAFSLLGLFLGARVR